MLTTLEAHRKFEREGPKLTLSWIEEGLEPLRGGLGVLRSPGGAPRVVESVAVARLQAAQVILVADWHDLDPCRRAFGRAVVRGSTAEERDAGRIALAFEALPPNVEADARTVRRTRPSEGVDPLRVFLAAVWPWPVTEMAALLRCPDLRTCSLLAAGRATNLALPPLWTPDAEREPGLWGATEEDVKYGESFYRGNWNAKDATCAWIGGGEGRRVFVLYGAAHLLGEHNLATQLRAEGLRVLVLVPFLPDWEAAVRRRGEPDARDAWFEVAPDVMRAPLVGDDEVLALPPYRERD